MKTFEQFVKEDGGAAAGPAGPGLATGGAGTTGNTTAGIENYASPIGSSQPTAKKKFDEAEKNKFVVDSNAKKISGVTSRGV